MIIVDSIPRPWRQFLQYKMEGTILTPVSGDFLSGANSQVIDAKDVLGTIIIKHTYVTIRNYEASNIFIDSGASGAVVEYSTVLGGTGSSGITLLARSAIIRHNDISGVENGIWCESNGTLVEDNWIHDLAARAIPIHTMTGYKYGRWCPRQRRDHSAQ